MAYCFCGVFRRRETQWGFGCDAGEDRFGQDLWIFLSGINEDRLGESYRTYQPGRGFLEVPVWLSSGSGDTVATPQAHDLVKSSLERSGFKRVRLERFDGQHKLKMSEVRRALQWFRELGRF